MQQHIRIKICGITRPEDAVCAARFGADAVGLVFYHASKRRVLPPQAAEIVSALPPFVGTVGLFVNESAERIGDILAQVPLDVLQFHGDETPEFCRQFRRPYLKAVRVRHADDVCRALRDYADARGVLLDAHVAGEYGGTGQCFDWSLLPQDLAGNWILSGGLNPHNITAALAQTGAAAVDVSSGVEAAAGIKCPHKMADFIARCRQAHHRL
ncbi:phosphoribosylanthranilate isomerase [Conchiformibius kuhniae]|uniref:N-(5'-phosphoribosyl)anthranilate isomerase n=1 Tax=Conchiformibius kuhniae TaxID=211502 RepID=A0A8T9MWP8_9NEIS|nr:phosphoribosylanthranilate isomerase [Conchiformibius kuhniae]UOP04612.1 phosphoribosylanthranilate isomerase [Conchiformibius kuhniae]